MSDKIIWPGGSDIYTMPISKDSNNMRMKIDFDVFHIEHFENQLVVTLADGKQYPFYSKET
ncbi:hypothetical protein ACFFMO_00835 [Lederbergia wuyishanensis]